MTHYDSAWQARADRHGHGHGRTVTWKANSTGSELPEARPVSHNWQSDSDLDAVTSHGHLVSAVSVLPGAHLTWSHCAAGGQPAVPSLQNWPSSASARGHGPNPLEPPWSERRSEWSERPWACDSKHQIIKTRPPLFPDYFQPSETTSKSRPLTMDHTTENSPRKSPFQWQFSQNPIGVLSLIFFVGLRIFFGGCI